MKVSAGLSMKGHFFRPNAFFPFAAVSAGPFN